GMSMMFIDGGMSEIIISPSVSIHQLRLAMVSYSNKRKEASESRDFLVLSKMVEEDDKLFYIAKVFPSDRKSTPKSYKANIEDPSLKDGLNNGSISRFTSMILRFAELEFAEEMTKRAEKSILLLDGSLQATHTDEHKKMHSLISSCMEREILLIGFPKTTSMLTDTGQDITFSLRRLESRSKMRDKMWFYGPVLSYHDETFNADIIYAKLHKSAKKIFRIEICNKFEMVDLHKVLGDLASISADPVFLGYPYGLIKVDAIARVTNNERLQLRTRFMNKVALEDIESSSDAHSILDSISF
ncbi:MAG: DNA double-strand break repair nuclease NurA, partial [Candidatus Woesearchaeota archaeon]